jgi:tetratricopeptide (TPR) repeat protein
VRVVLRELETASLVAQYGPGRYRMHDLIRLYATETAHHDLAEDIRLAATDRLLEYYLSTTAAADQWVRSVRGQTVPVGGLFAGREQALAWLDVERANLVAAVTEAASTGRDRAAVVLAALLAGFLSWRQQLDDWVTVAQIAAQAAQRIQDPRQYAGALTNLGNALRQVRRFDEATTAHTAAGDIFRETRDRLGEGRAWNNLGLALQRVRRFDEAINAHTTAAMTIFWVAADRHGEGMAWNNLGLALRRVGRLEEAIVAHTTAVDIYRETGDRHGEGQVLANLGIALREVQRLGEAWRVGSRRWWRSRTPAMRSPHR